MRHGRRRRFPGRSAAKRSIQESQDLRSDEQQREAYAITFAGCAICSLIFVYDTTPNVLKVGKIAVAGFTLLFIGAEILALVT